MDNTRVVTAGGETYTIKKFDPETGCYWAFKFLGRMAGMGQGLDLIHKINEFVAMDRQEFREFQRDCLKHVFYSLPSGQTRLLDEDMNYTKIDMKPQVAFQLTIQTFLFTIIDFFDQGLLEEMAGSMQGLIPTTGPVNSSSTPSNTDTGTTTTSEAENTP